MRLHIQVKTIIELKKYDITIIFKKKSMNKFKKKVAYCITYN